ncbi:MAG: DUF2752 domain-containing protein [Bacteroidales bacterium]|nr:DUF2752 domain-containing protein [Bacteroidales bacterium]
MLSYFAEWIEQHALPCLYKQVFGLSCPFCGLQRSLVALFNGDLAQSILYYPALIPLTLSVATLAVSRRARNSSKLTTTLVVGNAAIVVVSTVLKNLSVLPD